MIDKALASGDPMLEGIDRARLEREHWISLTSCGAERGMQLDHDRAPSLCAGREEKPFLPFAEGFATPSGKALLRNDSLVQIGLDPVASFTPPSESRHTAAARKFPLEMLGRKADNFLNTTFCNVESVQPLEENTRDVLEINRSDAESRGIQDGDQVRVWNDRGSLLLRAHVNGAVQPGVVAARLGWAKLSPNGANVNVLTSERLTDIAGGPTFYSCLVEVEPVRAMS
jgi:anaerobic selenocysteine-containing dehydrogenase